MKKYIGAAVICGILLSCACSGEAAEIASESTAQTEEETDSAETAGTEEVLTASDIDTETVMYTGDKVIDETDFEIFDDYFCGRWSDETETAPDDITLSYSDNRSFNLAYDNLLDIYCDENNAFLAISRSGEITIFRVPFDDTSKMYQYDETNHGGRAFDDYDFGYIKDPAEGTDTIGFFGIEKMVHIDGIPLSLLFGNELETPDGKIWLNYGEELSVLEKTNTLVTFQTKCYEDGYDPYKLGYSEDVPETFYICYSIKYIDESWSYYDCYYKDSMLSGSDIDSAEENGIVDALTSDDNEYSNIT